jgi:hypothetical protein
MNSKARGTGEMVCFIFVVMLLISTTSAFAQTQTTSRPAQPQNTAHKSFSPFPHLFTQMPVEDIGHKPRIRPHFAFNQGYVSNARLGTSQADAAWQARIAPGIGISVPYKRLLAEVDYTYSFFTSQGRKTDQNTSTHNLDGLLRYELTSKTTLAVGNDTQWSDIPLVEHDTFFLETVNTQLIHSFTSKFRSDLVYAFQYYDDRTKSDTTSREQDFSDHGIIETVHYDLTEALTFSPAFSWNVRDFKRVRDKDYWQISPVLGAAIRLGSKTTLGGHFGWAFRKFDHGTAGTGKRESELVYGSSLQHFWGRKFVWRLQYDKTLQDTYNTGFVYREDAETIPFDNFDRNFRVVKNHRIDTRADYFFNEKFSSGVFGTFQFTTNDEKDNVVIGKKNTERGMEVGAKASYRLWRYMSLDILYAFGRRFSSTDEESESRRDYTFHKVTGGVSIQV